MHSGNFEVKRFKSGHAVFDEHQNRLTGILTHSVAFDRAMDLHRMSKWKTRKCLRCRDEFTSEGAHNRMCWQCRNSTSSGLEDCTVATRL